MLLLILFFLCAFAGLTKGAVDLNFLSLLASLSDGTQDKLIFFELRLPRVLLALVIGANLALCGAVSQGLFRNPLADPSLIGVTAGASLGASIAIFFSLAFSGALLFLPVISVAAFVGGLIAVLLVYQLATRTAYTSVSTMLLCGIAVTAFASAISGLLDFYADNEALRRMSLWRMGGLEGATYQSVGLAAFVLFILIFCLQKKAVALDALLLGESEARHLGIDVKAVKQLLIILIALGTGTAVALAGTIAFVGLIIPHILRLLLGPSHRLLLPASAFGGAILLSLADTFSRTVVAPTELPVGLLTALLGAPFFIILLRQRHGH